MSPGVDTTIKTYDRIALDYLERSRDRTAISHHLERFAGLIRSQELDIYPVVDVGCGPGYDISMLRQRGLSGIGIDLSWGMLETGINHYPGSFVQANMLQIPLSKSAGGLWSCASLLHLPRADAPRALKEFARVLITSGVLYISVKMGAGQRWSSTNDNKLATRLFTLWQPGELDKLLITTGFQIIHASTETAENGTVWLSRFSLKDGR
jgi:ubiquinone/menaquinone biosynthesis C-methylase UbiE